MKINIHAGHSAIGGGAPGAVGILSESVENRKVKDILIKLLKENGHTVYDCTVDRGSSSSVLVDIVKKCNAHKVDLDISLHFNAGGSRIANGATTGTETLVYSQGRSQTPVAQRIANAIAELGFKNRGVKVRPDLYVLKHTNAPAILVECCFVDDPDDAKLYDATKMAKAIYKGITGKAAGKTSSTSSSSNSGSKSSSNDFKVKVIVNKLNIRSGAGVTNKTVGSVKKGEVYTITETKKSWGKLKSGAGWINISSKYVKEI